MRVEERDVYNELNSLVNILPRDLFTFRPRIICFFPSWCSRFKRFGVGAVRASGRDVLYSRSLYIKAGFVFPAPVDFSTRKSHCNRYDSFNNIRVFAIYIFLFLVHISFLFFAALSLLLYDIV